MNTANGLVEVVFYPPNYVTSQWQQQLGSRCRDMGETSTQTAPALLATHIGRILSGESMSYRLHSRTSVLQVPLGSLNYSYRIRENQQQFVHTTLLQITQE